MAVQKSTRKALADAKTWAEFCVLKGGEYEEYLKTFPNAPSYADIKRPSGEPADFPIWRGLFFGKGSPERLKLFLQRCINDIDAMFSEDIFERCQHNPASKFPADRALARCVQVWLRLFSGTYFDVETLRLAADDYSEWVARESFGAHDDIDEFLIIKSALLYFLVGDHKRAEMMILKLSGKKVYHINLVDFARAILTQKPLSEMETKKLLTSMLAVNYYWDPKRASYAESDVNFLLLATWACFKGGVTIDKAAASTVELSRTLVQ